MALVAASANGAAPAPVTGWLTFGGGAGRLGEATVQVGAPRTRWFSPIAGSMTTQPLVAHNVPTAGATTVYVGTASGFVYALAVNGYVRWRADLGHLVRSCPQIPDGWGVTGTPVIDPASHALYVMDAFGRLHALDLATGSERPGWPIVLYRDYRKELDWGASTLIDGSVYVPTGSFCDQPPMEGKLIRIELATKKVTSWISVPLSLGGGGSVWGWGGPAYSAQQDSIYVGTGNTFEGGKNVGKDFSEQAGYGEHLVQLSPDLEVEASSAPDLGNYPDNGFVGSPVIVDRPGCDELVAAQTKSGTLFGWRAADVASGPVWRVQLQKSDPATPMLTQPAYSARFDSLYVSTSTSLLRISLDATCHPNVTWTAPLGNPTLYGSPLVTGSTVWVALPGPEFSGKPGSLIGFDARTGRIQNRIPLSGMSFAQPSALEGVLFMGSMHAVTSGTFSSAPRPGISKLPEQTSGLPGGFAWQSREDGVYATDDAGRHWRRIYPTYAVRVVRLSQTSGVIATGLPATTCNCAPQRLWTSDGGRTWRPLRAIGGEFQGRGSLLYWWNGGDLFLTTLPSTKTGAPSSRRMATVDGTIVSAANAGDGIVALVDRGARPPQVVLVVGDLATPVTLPDAGDGVVARSVSASGQTVVVRGRDFSSPTAGPDPAVEWRSSDGGRTWTGPR